MSTVVVESGGTSIVRVTPDPPVVVTVAPATPVRVTVGTVGPAGPPGVDGADGAPGAPGADGSASGFIVYTEETPGTYTLGPGQTVDGSRPRFYIGATDPAGLGGYVERVGDVWLER